METYKDCDDVVFQSFLVAGKFPALMAYVDGLTNTEELDENVLRSLMSIDPKEAEEWIQADEHQERFIPISSSGPVNNWQDGLLHLSGGHALLLVQDKGFFLSVTRFETRQIVEPETEPVIRGPKDGFIESMRINTALLRRKIRTPRLKMKTLQIGRLTATSVTIVYIQDLADPKVIQTVWDRLQQIDIDGVLESSYLEEFIEDHPYSPFPQVKPSERVDVVASSLLQGRIAIVTDNTPVVLTLPITLPSLLQSPEDYYERYTFSTAVRWLRIALFICSITLPSLYISIMTFHQEMIPTQLLNSIASAREAIPFPTLIEVLIMEAAFESLREAGIRLPKQVGFAVTIVGALVIGEAAVSAGIISSPIVIVVAFTGIASFTVPRFAAGLPIRLLRFPLTVISGIFGLVGMMIGLIVLCIHLCSIKSFGVNYMSPFAPIRTGDFKDVIVRAPWWKMNQRPSTVHGNPNRQPVSKPSADRKE
ncbi:spore germination protein [Paenibacillus campinasensis]|uniref:Spore germination protein n=1 Tax=Paenibacillus campinasensis TaxID=66347 RepID=A0A268ESN9_9BACL|nr:spore germination protein [Paenibacillus campinasensis]PAD76149.1 hypothetical protein CHH67_12930 [Paenibacillus campinasensis]